MMAGRLDSRINSSLDDIIDSQPQQYGRVARKGRAAGASQRSQPYGGGRGAQQQGERGLVSETLDNSATPENAIKVASGQDAKEIATRIVDGCRANDPPALLTIGAQSINQAVKAIAIARAELIKEGRHISFQPAFRHTDRTKPLIAFYIAQERGPRNSKSEEDDITLTAASSSRIVPIAGAIAGKVRENLKTSVQAIGVDAVTNAVLAIGNARLFLERDNCDIRVEPEFEKVEKNGSIMTALRMSLVAENL